MTAGLEPDARAFGLSVMHSAEPFRAHDDGEKERERAGKARETFLFLLASQCKPEAWSVW